jgi:hypothetical protein
MPSPAVESERRDWLQPFVAAGLGIALVADTTALLPGIMTRPIAGLALSRQIELVMPGTQPLAEPAQRFLRLAGLEGSSAAKVTPLGPRTRGRRSFAG